jgi:peptide deformylase
MSDVMNIYKYPHPVLREKALPVKNIDASIQELIDRMAETMYSAGGIGLAANQVGILKRVIVFDITPTESGRNFNVLINPEIIVSEGKIVHDEACLSVIDYSAEVRRSAMVRVKGFDRDGRPVEIDAENNLLAICLQHEIDHLNGILFIDHISHLKRSLYNRRLKKLLKKNRIKT